MSVTEIIQAVENLSPVDRAKVADALSRSNRPNPNNVAELEAEFHQHLINIGMLKSIPDKSLPQHHFNRIRVKGKPLSETIIEERR